MAKGNMFGSCVLKASMVKCQSIPLINTRPILDQHSINTLVDTPLTLHQHLTQQSFKSHLHFQSVHMSRFTLNKLSADCWSNVDQVLTEYWPGCWSKVSVEGNDWHLTTDAFNTHDSYVFSENTNVLYMHNHINYVLNTVSESFYSLPLPVVLIIKSNSVFQKFQLFHIFWCTRFVRFWTESFACFIFLEGYLFEINKQTKMSWLAILVGNPAKKAGLETTILTPLMACYLVTSQIILANKIFN